MTTYLYIFRHGQTDWNKQGLLQGHSDIPLNETGIAQAKALASKFSSIQIDHIYSSDLIRAKDTAKFVFNEREMFFYPELREISCGDYEGVHRDHIGEDIIATILNNEEFKFPNGESKSAHFLRLKNILLKIHSLHAGKKIAVSTHGGSMARILESCPTYDTTTYIDNCALALVTITEDQFVFHHFL